MLKYKNKLLILNILQKKSETKFQIFKIRFAIFLVYFH